MKSLWRKWGVPMKTRDPALRGTGKVFRFSLQQYFKSAATYVMLAFMLIGAGASVLLMGISMNRGEEMGSDARTVYIRNESPYALDPAAMPDYVHAALTDKSMEELLMQLDAGETDGVVVEIAPDAASGLWRATAYTGAKTAVMQEEARNLAACCAGLADEARYAAMGVDPRQMGIALAPVSTSVLSEAEFRDAEEDEEGITTRQVGNSAYSILVFMLISFSTSFIVRAVVQEKSSKLVELLMVSVKPLALISGKILAAMCLVAAGVVCSGVGLALSRLVLKLLGKEGMASLGIGSLLQGLSGPGILVVLVSVLLGYLSYSIIAGISGACCSTESESDNASSSAMLIAMVGYMAAMGTAWMKAGTAIRILSAIPFISVFIAPARFLSGDIGFGLLALSWLLQAAASALLMKLCAAVYGALMIHRGEKIGLKQVLRMAKGGARA